VIDRARHVTETRRTTRPRVAPSGGATAARCFQREDNQRFRDFVTEQVGATQGDPQLEAVTLLAIVDGLMTQMLIGHTDAETALATLDYHLHRIFGAIGAAYKGTPAPPTDSVHRS
jgi:hypothetical protein